MVALTALLMALASPRPHATLVSSEPAADAVLTASPARFRLVFSEPIDVALSSLAVEGAGGAESRLVVEADPRDVHALIARVQPLAPNAYRVRWRVVSADGHPVSGTFAFRIGEAAPRADKVATAVPVMPPPPAADSLGATPPGGLTLWKAPVVAALLRGLALAALMSLGGLLALGEWLLPHAGGSAVRLAPWLAAAALALLALHAFAWSSVATDGGGLSGGFAALTSSGSGQRELLRVGFALLALWAVALARRRGIAALCALLALVVSGAVGHPAAIQPLAAIPSKTLHLLGGAVWLGGLLWIVLADRTHPRYVEGARRISSFALVAVLIVAATGLAQMLLFLPAPSGVVRSPYGLLSLAKIAGLLVLVAFGAYHRYRLLPRLAPTAAATALSLRASVRAEVGVMLLVILIGGLLAYVPP